MGEPEPFGNRHIQRFRDTTEADSNSRCLPRAFHPAPFVWRSAGAYRVQTETSGLKLDPTHSEGGAGFRAPVDSLQGVRQIDRIERLLFTLE